MWGSPSERSEVGLALRWGCGVTGAGCSDMDMDMAGSGAETDVVTARHSSSAALSASTRRSAARASWRTRLTFSNPRVNHTGFGVKITV